jgi:hypothetical protein
MFDNSYDIIMGNSLYRDGLAMESRQISELSKLLTDEFTRARGNTPWKTIKGLRVILAHHYYKLDKNIMWNTLIGKDSGIKNFLFGYIGAIRKYQSCSTSSRTWSPWAKNALTSSPAKARYSRPGLAVKASVASH